VRFFGDHPLAAQDVLNILPNGIALIDHLGVIGELNNRLAKMTGYDPQELLGRNIRFVIANFDRYTQLLDRRGGEGEQSESHPADADLDLMILCRDGSKLPIDLVSSPIELDGNQWTMLSISDSTVQRAAEQARQEAEGHSTAVEVAAAKAIAESEQRFRLAFEGNMAPMVFSDMDGIFIEVNDSFCRMSGRSRQELVGRDSKHFTYPEDIGISEDVNRRISSGETDEARYSKRFLHQNGRIVIAEVSVCAARDRFGHAKYFISSVRDITEERALASQLSFQALHDPLTGLANRLLFDDRLNQARARVQRHGDFGAVLLLDLDDFKSVNDVYGHLIGDQLLVTIAHRFEDVSRSTDTLCRFGGDEFLYLAEGLTSPGEAEIIGQRLLDSLREPFDFDNAHIEQGASVGITVWDATSTCVTNVEFVQNADASMYEAKRLGKGQLVVFTSDIRNAAVSRFTLVQELRQAVKSGELRMHYQPIIDLNSSKVVGFESLMRWEHPERGWIPPDVFIRLAEESDLILELGAFAIHEVVAAASSWEPFDDQSNDPYVTVNLSARQFHDPDLIPMIERELKLNALAPERLVLEVTESIALLDIAETMSTMEHLNRLNIGVALDDFGTGYSSLSFLAALNPRIIKIDQSFVRPNRDHVRSDTLLEAIVTLGNKLDMTVLAEGIETLTQLEHLHNLNCDLGQGFLWSPAVPGSEVAMMLDEQSSH
jgi:diguanylate cyclase (GGDEF)-like protein/PAS domain S-box-containing protein